MKINHKKLNVVLGLVIVLVIGGFLVYEKDNAKQVFLDERAKDVNENCIAGDNDGVSDGIKALSNLEYKKEYTVEVGQLLSKQAYIHFLHTLPNKVEKFKYKFNDNYVSVIIKRNQMVGMLTYGDIVYVSTKYKNDKWEIVYNDSFILHISTNIKKHTRSNEEIKDIVNQLLVREGY